MGSQILRPYQKGATDAVFDALVAGYKRTCYTLPTGAGKTTVFSEITRHFLEDYSWRVLVVVDSRELVEQAFKRIQAHCDLSDFEIGVESNSNYCAAQHRVVVATIQTIYSERRLQGWIPDAIITDECHTAAAASFQKLFARFPDAVKVGCTATLKRLDRKSLAAEKPDGTPYIIEDKNGKRSPATKETSVFESHCFNYDLIEAIEDGWIVPIRGKGLPVPIDLSKVKSGTNENGEKEFNQKDLAEETDRDEVNDAIVSAWKQYAEDRPTIAFCASTHHAAALADHFTAAGIPSVSVDCETDPQTRHYALENLKNNSVKVLCNFGVYGKGVDAPNCSCILMAHMTKSWTRYMQRAGRATRPLDGLLNGMEDAIAEERLAKIAASAKPDALILDLVGVCGKHEVCTVPVMLDLPADLDLQGHSLTEAKKMIERVETAEEMKEVLGKIPKNFEELKIVMDDLELTRSSHAKSRDKWAVRTESPGTFQYTKTSPGYSAGVIRTDDTCKVVLYHKGQPILEKTGQAGASFKAYLDHAERWINWQMKEHRDAQSASTSRGTIEKLSPGRYRCLKANGHSDQEIDCMTTGYALKLVGQYMDAWTANKAQKELAEV